jgi:hypothetical protein
LSCSVRLALPDPHQPGARADQGRLEAALARRGRDLPQLAPGRRRQAAEGLHLELIGDGSDQQIAPKRTRRRVAVERVPALPERREAEAAQEGDLSLDLFLCSVRSEA